MTTPVELTQRQQQVFQATVQRYIATAEPVGSKVLVNEYDFQVSPATIRNAMGSLERAGLLYQPHTSAGRIPSDYGYRLYVDQLMHPSQAQSLRVGQELSDRLQAEDWSVETILRGAAQILSNISGYITLVTLPRQATARLHHLQLVPVEPGRAMLIVVTDAYHTHSGIVEIPQPSAGSEESQSGSQDEDEEQIRRELELLSNFLNHHLRSRLLTDLGNLDWQELGHEFQRYSNGICSYLLALSESHRVPHLTQILMSGFSDILRQPEFSQLSQFQGLFHLLEDEQELLWPLICEVEEDATSNRRSFVRIGTENPLEPMQSCTLIYAFYHRGDEPVGSIGVLGPTRMAYENAIAAVEATADYITDRLP